MIRSVRYIVSIFAIVLIMIADKNNLWATMWLTIIILALWTIVEIAESK